MMFYNNEQLQQASLFRLKELYARDFFNWKTNEKAMKELGIITEILKIKPFEERIEIDGGFRDHCDAAIKDGEYEIADKDMELRDHYHCKVLD